MAQAEQVLDERAIGHNDKDIAFELTTEKKESVKKPTALLDKGTENLHITFSKLALASLVNKCAAVSSNNASNAILGHVLIQASKEGGVGMVATDLELSIIARVEDPTVHIEGTAVMPLKELESIASLSGDVIELKIENGVASVSTDDSLWVVNTVDTMLFPDVQQIGDNARPIATNNLLRALEIVVPAMGRDEARPSIMMVSFDDAGVYATDGARAHFATLINEFAELHIPAPAVRPLMNLLRATSSDYIYIEETQSHVVFMIGQDEFATRMMDADFPGVRGSLINPRLNTHTEEFIIPRQRAIMGLKRAAAVSDDGSGSVTLQLRQDVCHFIASNAKGGRVVSAVECSYKGAPRSIQYLVSSLNDLLGVVKDEMLTIRLSPSASDGTILYHSPACTIVVLPRIRS